MVWIRVIEEDEAEGRLKEYYEEIKRARGKVANIMKIHSLHPEAMVKHLELYLAIMFRPGGLKREQREMIATVVSALNKCGYCTYHHAEALNFYWKDRERLQRLIEDYTQLDLAPPERTMLDYARKLTQDPASVTEADVQRLRDTGFSDEEILNINLVVSYFNFVNRVALGLGVEFSDQEMKGYKY